MSGGSITRRRALQVGAGGAMAAYLAACGGDGGGSADNRIAVSYTHLTLPTTPYV